MEAPIRSMPRAINLKPQSPKSLKKQMEPPPSPNEEEDIETVRKRISVKFDWYIDYASIKTTGYLQSPLFGTSSTKFYWRADMRDNGLYSIHLYLSACAEERMGVAVQLWFGEQRAESKYTFKGEVSLDKKEKVGYDIWSDRSYVTASEVTFEEIEVNIAKVTQLEHYELLSAQFRKLRLNSDASSDVSLLTTLDGRVFRAHKWILASRSTVFAAMFGNDEFLENQSGQVEIDDVAGEVMEALLDYVYTADIGKIGKVAEDLLLAADKYDIPLLVESCIQNMLKRLSVKNAAKYFYLADLHRAEDVKKAIIVFINENRREVRESPGWKQFIGLEQLQLLYDSLLGDI